MQSNSKLRQSGFGLVEVLVSISIFTLVMVGISQLSRVALYNYETSKNRTVAYNVIQQAFEEMRNKRDSNVVKGSAGWYDEMETVTFAQIRARSAAQLGLPNGKIVIESVGIGENASQQQASQGQARSIKVRVEWSERRGPQSLTAITYLTDWKSKY